MSRNIIININHYNEKNEQTYHIYSMTIRFMNNLDYLVLNFVEDLTKTKKNQIIKVQKF